MHFISIFLFAVSSNIDSFILSIAYGMKKIHIKYGVALVISFITVASTVVSMTFGKSLLHFIPLKLGSILGSLIIICMGAYYIIIFLKNSIKASKKTGATETSGCYACIDAAMPKKNETEEVLKVDHLSYKEAGALGIALSMNNMGLGIGASITGLNIPFTSAATFICSFVFLCMGNKIGNSRVLKVIGAYAEPISGCIIIALGILEIYI